MWLKSCGVASLMVIVAAQCIVAAEPLGRSDEGVEFYEKRVRPLLVENCYQCHGPNKQRAGLRLDSLRAVLEGGDRGPAVQLRDPDHSLLVRAVRYTDEKLRMPPRGKLTDQQINDLIRWVEMGAPGPNDEELNQFATAGEFDLAKRRKHWAYEPVRSAALPSVANASWADSPIDLIILARLEALGISPANAVDRRTWLRRVTFDLIGLPPEPAEVESFLGDMSPDAFDRVVDRLLTSPQYGERWGRHWLDLVRYAETLAFEFDYDLYNAWRYRDYVIRAWNNDLPYDQFFIEHLAGDLIANPRYEPAEGVNESILATGFFWMGEGKQTPVDIRQEQADRIDNQIDVLGKAFLGQTIACARCHDHKFDAISTRDYYSLAGYLKSSRYQQAFIDSPDRNQLQLWQLTKLKEKIGALAGTELTPSWLELVANADQYLSAAQHLKAAAPEDPLTTVEALAAEFGLNPSRLEKWISALRRTETVGSQHPLFTWVQLLDHGNNSVEQFRSRRDAKLRTLRNHEKRAASSTVELFHDFRRDGHRGWYVTGDAFNAEQLASSDFVVGVSEARPIARFTTSVVDSGRLSGRLQGELRSPSFTIKQPFVHLRLAGQDARVNLVIDGNTLIMNPMYGKLTVKTPDPSLTWQTIPTDRWIGHRAYFEVSDTTIPMHGLNPPPSTARVPEGPANGYIALDRIVFSDQADPPVEMPNQLNAEVLEQSNPSNSAELAAAYRDRMVQAVRRSAMLLRRRPAELGSASATGSDADRHATAPSDDELNLLNWLLENGLLDQDLSDDERRRVAPRLTMREIIGQEPSSFSVGGATELQVLARAIGYYRSVESALVSPRRAPALADGTGEDESVFLRGNYATLGERVPRGPPEVLTRSDQSSGQPSDQHDEVNDTPMDIGSGRLALARRLAVPTNPLLARVIVNRIWQHHFGAGIVRTSDDFGRMGQSPSHPELLDYLALELVRSGWSLKPLHRRIVLSKAYRMSNLADPSAMQQDPENRLLHHMPIRRLEAEAIRDAVLSVSGRLDRSLYGPSVLPHVTSYMEGRGRPNSGPLDGNGRRSIYINARRNFLTPLLLAFDYPVSFSTIGRRGVSTVPAQALTLMNDPFVGQQAGVWAQRLLAEAGPSTQQRIHWLYQIAFARPPTTAEMREAEAFIENQSARGPDDAKAWANLCHVFINVKEFIFIE